MCLGEDALLTAQKWQGLAKQREQGFWCDRRLYVWVEQAASDAVGCTFDHSHECLCGLTFARQRLQVSGVASGEHILVAKVVKLAECRIATEVGRQKLCRLWIRACELNEA